MKNNNKYQQATRKMLYNYSSLLAELYIKQRELDHVKNNDGLTGVAYTATSECRGNDTSSKVESVAERNMKNEQQLQREIDTLRMNIDKINTVLDILSKNEKLIIQMRYIDDNKKDWGYISDNLGYSARQAQRMEKHALTKITSLLFGTKSFIDLPLFEYMESVQP